MSSVFKDSTKSDPAEYDEFEDENQEEGEDGDLERMEISSSQSSDDENKVQGMSSSVKDIHSHDARWTQMKRNAQKKNAHKGKNRLKGLVSLEQMQKAHALKRMQEGMRTLLSLHHPVELSSICGCLKLKTQQKANVSINQIIKYASEKEEIDELLIKNILHFMYEAALWEYLHSIGHPVHNIVRNPRDTILEIWQKGGLLGSNTSFVPHFVKREVRKRNEWVTSPDIQKHLESIAEAQERVKVAERKVISDHDYTHILSYFQAMSALRALETSCREYLIQELEMARSHLDSDGESQRLSRELLKDCEVQFMAVAEELNRQLAYAESVCALEVQKNVKLQGELLRLQEVLQSYSRAEKDRAEPEGGTMGGLKLRHPSLCHPLIQQLGEKLMQYKDARDESDDLLRMRARCHVQEIVVLRGDKAQLLDELATIHEYKKLQAEFTEKLMGDFVRSQRQLSRAESYAEQKVKILGDVLGRLGGKVTALEGKLRKAKPVLLAGTTHSQSAVRSLSLLLLQHFNLIAKGEEEERLREGMEMGREDLLSSLLQQNRTTDEERRQRLGEGQSGVEGKGGKSKGGKSGKGGGNSMAKGLKSPSKSSVGGSSTKASSKASAKPSSSSSAKKKKK